MYDRMIREHGYSIRKLAEKLGKDKGYLENRLRLADAPPEVRELVSLRKDTLSHAYELMKVEDPKKRKKLAEQVARNELSLVKLRERIEGRTADRRSRTRWPKVLPKPVDGGIGPARRRGSRWTPSTRQRRADQRRQPRHRQGSSSTRPSRTSWTSSATRTCSGPSGRSTGRTSRST